MSPGTPRQLAAISARQIDRRLRERKQRLKHRRYGRTRPGALRKHQIPVKTDAGDVRVPGFPEVDVVSHSRNVARGEFAYSLNVTDLHTTWTETCAVLGKGEAAMVRAFEASQTALPFRLLGIDSDKGSEFINWHLGRCCWGRDMQWTRSRPYKKDDNAHLEQKNWTHVRRFLGWDRYDTPQAVEAINDLYQNELRLWLNLFQPSVKLGKKLRVGAGLRGRPKPRSTACWLPTCAKRHRPRRCGLCAAAWIRSSWPALSSANSNASTPWPTAASAPDHRVRLLAR